MNLLPIFITGLLTGGLTCFAVQGGLLAATIAQRKETDSFLPILAFLVSKLIAYTFLGALLGLFGSVFQLSITTKVILQIIVSIFMIGIALNLLNVHPIFRYFLIQPPKFLTKIVRNQSKSKSFFAPAVLGATTIFIPCGTTQAMMALSIASGNWINGATVLFAFILGTSPVFFLIGYLATRLGDVLKGQFMKFAAAVIILLAVFNIDSAIRQTGSKYSLNYLFRKNTSIVGRDTNALTEITINIENSGYNPDYLVIKKGALITLHLKNTSRGGCQQAFTIPKLGIQKIVPPGETVTIQFTTPSEEGELVFTCSMGMYRGVIKII